MILKQQLKNNIFIGAKLYPNNATTNSLWRYKDIKKIYNIFRNIRNLENSILLIHGELNRKDIRYF